MSKNADFDAYFELLKSSKKVGSKKVRGLRTFVQSILKGEKVINFYTFLLITFFKNFFTIFTMDLKSASKCEKNIFWVILVLFTNSKA